jgi:hypothetical protein
VEIRSVTSELIVFTTKGNEREPQFCGKSIEARPFGWIGEVSPLFFRV